MARAWMPLYVGDYLADTGHLTTAQHGAYILLILHYWQRGGLPDDDQALARICRLRVEDWRRRYRGAMIGFFGPGWRHTRIDAELSRSAEISNKRKEAAKQMHSKCKSSASILHDGLHTQSQSQSPIKKDQEQDLQNTEAPVQQRPLPECDHRLGGQRRAGDITNRLLGIGKPLANQDRADQRMAEHLVAKRLALDAGDAWAVVMAARDPNMDDHKRARRLCLRESAEHKLAWFDNDLETA